MANTRVFQHCRAAQAGLLAAALALPASAIAAQSYVPPRPVIVAPAPAAHFQQVQQQQQTRNQLQKSDVQQQLHRGVSDNARRPAIANTRAQQQQDQAQRAQQQRDQASQQAMLERERQASELPRVIPRDLPAPAPARSSG